MQVCAGVQVRLPSTQEHTCLGLPRCQNRVPAPSTGPRRAEPAVKLPLEENAGRWDQDCLVEIQLPHTRRCALGLWACLSPSLGSSLILPASPSCCFPVQDDLGPSSGLGTLRQAKANKRKEWLKLFQIWDTHHRPPPTAPHPRQGLAAPGALRPSPHNTTSQESEPSPPSLHFHSCWNQEMRF